VSAICLKHRCFSVNALNENKKRKELFEMKIMQKYRNFLTAKSSGIDGMLVTVGLCIIALVLCVVMKDSLTTFITSIVTSLQEKAVGILDVSKV